jgi:predicted RNA-binding protein with TRAM domain
MNDICVFVLGDGITNHDGFVVFAVNVKSNACF